MRSNSILLPRWRRRILFTLKIEYLLRDESFCQGKEVFSKFFDYIVIITILGVEMAHTSSIRQRES